MATVFGLRGNLVMKLKQATSERGEQERITTSGGWRSITFPRSPESSASKEGNSRQMV